MAVTALATVSLHVLLSFTHQLSLTNKNSDDPYKEEIDVPQAKCHMTTRGKEKQTQRETVHSIQIQQMLQQCKPVL